MLKPSSIILACAIAAFQATAVQAQSYPSRDVTFIVPWNAGGSNDVAARARWIRSCASTASRS